MSPLDVALRYMEIFFSGRNLERLHEILGDPFEFTGPLYRFDSARAYVESLQADPPEGFAYRLLQTFADGGRVNLIYQFSKPGVETVMSQFFQIRDGRIARTLLIFDTGPFNA